MAYLAEFNIKKKYDATVMKTKRLTPLETEEVREIILEIEQPDFKCKVDQSFGILITKASEVSEFGNVYHHRLYSNADLPAKNSEKTQITFLVKRCSYIDELSGQLYTGVASNYLCSRKVGDKLTVTGPFRLPFVIPEDKTSNLILIGLGTGIAPFRAMVKYIYKNVKDWEGKIRLFYGARSGLELLYWNDKDVDLTNYYDEITFEAFSALSSQPHRDDPIAFGAALESRGTEILEMLSQNNTYIYMAGYEKVSEMLDTTFSRILGSKQNWKNRKAKLVAGKKWAEVIY